MRHYISSRFQWEFSSFFPPLSWAIYPLKCWLVFAILHLVAFFRTFFPHCWAGYIEPVMVVLHEKEPTWAGRITWKHHTCMISALSISTTLKQHPLIWSAAVSCLNLKVLMTWIFVISTCLPCVWNLNPRNVRCYFTDSSCCVIEPYINAVILC